MGLDATGRGLSGFWTRQIQTLRFFTMGIRFIFFYLTRAREVRRRYAEAERTGNVIWLDRGPFRQGTGKGPH